MNASITGFLVPVAMLLTACNQAAGVPDDFQAADTKYDTATAHETSRSVTIPNYPLTVGQTKDAIASLSKSWAEPIGESNRFDSFSGGESITVFFKDGTLNLFTVSDGSLWKVRLNSGVGDRCGVAIEEPVIRKFVDLTGVTGPQSDEVVQTLATAVHAGKVQVRETDGIRFAGAGECVQSLTATVLSKLPA